MATSPETNNQTTYSSSEGGVQEVLETPEIPETEQQLTGMNVRKSQFTAQVQDDSGQQLIGSLSSNVTLVIPATKEQLDLLAQESPDNSRTGFAKFWRRLIKKANFFKWNIIRKGGT